MNSLENQMDCLECGGTYQQQTGTYLIVDPYVGKIVLEGVSYSQCNKCGDILYSAQMAEQLDSARNNRINEILNQYPIGDFTTSADTAQILGISRQALHKNARINHGFIYHINFGSNTFYLRKSVQQYKEFGDGRFPFYAARPSASTEYLEHTPIPSTFSSVYELSRIPTKPLRPLPFEPNPTNPKEYSYASQK